MCCYLDSLDTIAVNRKLCRITNPTVGLYFALLVEILRQVKAKNKFNQETGEFKLNRQYVTLQTGIETSEQRNCEDILSRLGIVSVSETNADRLIVDMEKYVALLADTSVVPEDILPKTVKMTRAEKTAAKKAGIQAGIVKLFSETDPVAIDAVTKLVDVYYSQHGYCKKSQWEPIVQLLHACTTDPDGISEIVDYILTTNWQSIQAAIASFMKKHKPTGTRLNSQQKVSTGILEGVEF